jgi:hypothetical protein
MLRIIGAVAVAFALGTAPARAETIKGQIKDVDPAAKTLTLTVEGKERVFAVPPGAAIYLTTP